MHAGWKLKVSLRTVIAIGWYLALCVGNGGGDKGLDPQCPTGTQNTPCNQLGIGCMNCSLATFEPVPTDGPACKYGATIQVPCTMKPSAQCQGERTFTKATTCAYCYQLDSQYYVCNPVTNCNVIAAPPDDLRLTKCTVNDSTLCFGQRTFNKRVPCRWTTGKYKWSTALILSVTLGGFGVDRFYLGLWRSGLGKLFSFGGLGVWTIIDVILIATGYVGPADNTVYMY